MIRHIRYNGGLEGAYMAIRTETAGLLTVGEVSRILRVAESTVRKWIGGNRIPFIELPGGDYRIPRKELLRSLRGNIDVGEVLKRIETRLSSVQEADIEGTIAEVRAGRRAPHD